MEVILMEKENTFNKQIFAILLDKAKGDRSINQYANETDISAAHISRFLRQMIDTSPTPETISKFAEKAANGVTYKDFMIAAGHIAEDGNNVEEDSPRSRLEDIRRTEQEMFQIVLGYLMNSEYKWSMEKPDGRTRFPDMVFNLEDYPYKKWYFEFKASRGRSIGLPIHIIHNFYGMLLTFELKSTDKFTFVTSDENVFKYMLRKPPVNLKVNLFVMLVDLLNRKVVQEEKLCEY